MSQKKEFIKTNTHITAPQTCNHPGQLHAYPCTPVKKHPSDSSNNIYSSLSPFPFPPKSKDVNHIQFSNELCMIETPFPKQPAILLQQQDNQVPLGGGGRIIFQSIEDENGNNNSSQSNSEQISELSKSNSNQQSISGIQEESQEINNNSRQVRGQQLSGTQSANLRKFIKNKASNNPSKDADPNRRVFCNCKKTKCLKLYCDCFRLNLKCDEHCNCVGCHNLETYNQQRNNAILSLMDRNPDPFGQKIEANKHVKGCNCKKSNCLKKYCECFQAGLKCNQNCKCQGCKNCDHEKSQQQGDKGISKLTAKKERKMVEI